MVGKEVTPKTFPATTKKPTCATKNNFPQQQQKRHNSTTGMVGKYHLKLFPPGREELFFQLYCCVSFLFWREIGFGFTYLRMLLNNFLRTYILLIVVEVLQFLVRQCVVSFRSYFLYGLQVFCFLYDLVEFFFLVNTTIL